MTVEQRTQDGVTVLQLHGRLDATSASDLERHMTEVIAGGARSLVMDLAGLEYISSAGLRVLLSSAKRTKQAKGKLTLAAPTAGPRQVLTMAGFPAVVPLFDTTALAIASFLPPAPKAPAAPVHLSFAEEVYLLALDDKRGVIKPVPFAALDSALAGAVLMELAILDRIDTETTGLKVVSAAPTGDPLLDDALAKMQRQPAPQPTTFWLKHLADPTAHLPDRVLGRLVEKGILKQVDQRVLWVFAVRSYPVVADKEVKEVRARLRELILGDDIPDPRDVVLISLGNASRLLEDLFTQEEYKQAQPRIKTLARMDLIGQETAKAIRQIERELVLIAMPMI